MSASVNETRYLRELDKVQDEIVRLKERGAESRADFLHVLVPMIERMDDLTEEELSLMRQAVREAVEEARTS